MQDKMKFSAQETQAKLDAYTEALRNADVWADGAVVIETGDGYKAVPGAYLTDISYTEVHKVIKKFPDGKNVMGSGFDAEDLSDAELHYVVASCYLKRWLSRLEKTKKEE